MPFTQMFLLRKFALALHQIWPTLTREFIDEVHLHQEHYPVLSVPNRFVVPGGFFKVYFYWDTYWILKGLYFSKLVETARGMLENFAHMLHFHGFIPNSGNIQSAFVYNYLFQWIAPLKIVQTKSTTIVHANDCGLLWPYWE